MVDRVGEFIVFASHTKQSLAKPFRYF